jgi:hypothetical protein
LRLRLQTGEHLVFVREEVLVFHGIGFVGDGFKESIFGLSPVRVAEELVLFHILQAQAEVGFEHEYLL